MKSPPKQLPKITSAIWREVGAAIERVAAWPVPMVIAVSGGADSLCLCECMRLVAKTLPIQPLVAHFNHQLRGAESAADAEFVQAFAEARDLPVQIGHGDVAAHAQHARVSIEVAARQLRYDFLTQVALAHAAPFIGLAHHADDQAETLLLRLVRGTGVAGLQGMRPISPLPTPNPHTEHIKLLRPLLRTPRADIEAFCNEHGLIYRQDSSNNDPHHLRNRVRHELLPLLSQYNPGIRTVLANLAETAAEDTDIVNIATQQTFEKLRLPEADGESLRLNRSLWRGLSIGLQRATLREGVRRVQGDLTHLKFVAIEEARLVLNSTAKQGEIAVLGHLRIIINGELISFS
ncbi:MAG: tRNA lysidine(34) synthetase TilS [Anaerolineae bacterium]|nr:tRNA lysidine(34) synthetase TilS [Anaerolineae bacterium]